MWLKIMNQGEIELGAFRLIGACTKRDDDSAIGFFGSGLKYAISTLLRENIEIKIFSGEKEIKLHVETEMFRGNAFNVIWIDGEKSNFTTDMGIKWKVWQAIREVYCNALDEKKWGYEQVGNAMGYEGETNFYIKICDKVKEIADNWKRYFCKEREAHWRGEHGEVYHPLETNTCLYRKGIRCYDGKYNSLFDYNIFNVDINESRIIENTYEMNWRLSQIWSKPSDFMLKKLFETYMNSQEIETKLEYDLNSAFFNPSDVWKEFLRGYVLVPYSFAGHYLKNIGGRKYYLLRKKLISKLRDTFGEDIETITSISDHRFTDIPIGEREKYLLKEVMNFFKEVKVDINYPIKYGIFVNKETLGMAFNQTIILSDRCMNTGKKQIAETILEEAMHLDSLTGDETRGFQSYILSQLITCLENAYGIFL